MSDSITIRLPGNVQRELRAICKKEKIPLSDIVRESIKRYIAIRQFRKLRSRVLPFAEVQGLLTDDDIFSAVK
jgi:predicted transcriptional regulator